MKKIIKTIKLITLVMISVLITDVSALNYALKELIPNDIETTIVTNNFSYKGLSHKTNINDSKYITFTAIKNISDANRPITVSVALFDEKQQNIGIINYCSTHDSKSPYNNQALMSKEETTYKILIEDKYLAKKKTVKDIKYISVLSENTNCNTKGSLDYVGEKVEKIGTLKHDGIGTDVKLLLVIFEVLLAVGFVLFLQQYLFTNSFINFDGEDVRKAFNDLNKKLKRERESKPKAPSKPKQSKKSPKIIDQENKEKSKENKEQSDLHNFYK